MNTLNNPQIPKAELPLAQVVSFLLSMIVHTIAFIMLGLSTIAPIELQLTEIELVAAPKEEELEVMEEFEASDTVMPEIGASSFGSAVSPETVAPTLADVPQIKKTIDFVVPEVGLIHLGAIVEATTGLDYSKNLKVHGDAGQGVTGTSGAIDRMTEEILLSMEERKTLVVWLFDQSGSLTRQRKEIYERVDRIYEELGVIEAVESKKYRRDEMQPLLTSVYCFGQGVYPVTRKPTANIEDIRDAIGIIPDDITGDEHVFTAVYQAASKFAKERKRRNVMLIVVSDEAGDDQNGLEETVRLCRRFEMPVYCIGVPAPFGRQHTYVKWVDPDPAYDQSPQWSEVRQGPETLLPERVQLAFSAVPKDETPIDSGFGPYSLTRLCYETGGIYFTVHPNREMKGTVRRSDVPAFSSHIRYFFHPDVMQKYRPDYVSMVEYQRLVNSNGARRALVGAARMSWIANMESPSLRFFRETEAIFANELTEAQKTAARLEPQVEILYEALRQGQRDREQEVTPRWQAGYDLAMGRVIAVKVRMQAYNAMLAMAKRGMTFKNSKNNTWQLKSDPEITVSTQLANLANKGHEYLQRVVDEHPGTPWAMTAQKELAKPFGWRWEEEYTYVAPPAPPAPVRPVVVVVNPPPPPPPPRNVNLNPRIPMLPKPKPRRAPPRL
ncbi:MAG: vWA domain-containing protein [Pirellulaceae bacterium]